MRLSTTILLITLASGGPNWPECGVIYCEFCYAGCEICNGGSFNECTQCISNYYWLSGICMSRTPIVINDDAFTIDFSKIKLDKDPSALFVIGSDGGNVYPNFDANDPVPSISRGYYFLKDSYMSSEAYNFNSWFTVIFWVKPISSGRIFTKKTPSSFYQSLYISASGLINYQILVTSGESKLLQMQKSIDFYKWHYIAIANSLESAGGKAQLYVDGNLISEAAYSNAFYDDPATTYLGNLPSDKSFTGFIWKIILYGNANHHFDDFRTSDCDSGCFSCSSNLKCPDNCGFKQFMNNGECVDCSNDCYYGCRSAGTCNLCLIKECATCNSFYECSSCVEGADLINSVCTCSGGKVFTGVKCEYCDILCISCLSAKHFSCSACQEGYYLAGQICLRNIPFGWDNSKSSPYIVIEESFETETFKGSYGVFNTGTDKNTFAPFNAPEASDPIPMIKRGLYFDNGAYLRSNSEVYLPYEFSMNLWINPKGGDFLEKLNRVIAQSLILSHTIAHHSSANQL